jgi:hypothetical protein
MVYEEATSYFRSGMDFDPCYETSTVREKTRKKTKLVLPKPMRQAMTPQSV